MSNHHVDERLSCGCEVCINSTGMSYLVQCALHLAAPDLLAACEAAVQYDNAIRACANDPYQMSSYCTAQGENLDTLYLDWITKAHAAIIKIKGE